MPRSPKQLAPIENGVSYALPDFQQRSGLGRHAFTQARRQGLEVCRVGGRVYVRGDDWNQFLASRKSQ
jgi:hypothetical protein